MIRRLGVVDRVPAFHLGHHGFDSGGVGNLNFYLGTGCLSFACVLSCVVSGGGSDIVLITHAAALVLLSSVLVHSLLFPLQAPDPRAFGL